MKKDFDMVQQEMSDSRRSNDSAMRVDRDFDKDVKPRLDNPPNSRLFIVCNKNITEEEFQEAFEKYGNIEEIWVVRDRTTRKPKGVTYIKFSKTSEAALALEEMNGRRIGNHTRALKVMIAHRDQGSKREMNEEERLLRLFCVVPKTMTDSELREHFEQFGDIDYVSIVKDRETKESKGFAYVKYHRVSHAAKAFEGCDRSFKAVFAEPKRQQKTPFEQFDRFHGGNHGGPSIGFESGFSSFSKSSTNLFGVSDSGGVPTTLRVIAASSLNQDQLWKLFDLIPGLDYLHLDPKAWMGKGQATVVYNSSQAASYAMEKLHGFEYPPGQRLIVKPDPDVQLPSRSNSRESFPGLTPSARSNTGVPGTLPGGLQASSIASLAETLAQAQSLIQAAGLAKPGSPASTLLGGTSSVTGETYDPSYCSVKLPPPQPLAPIDSVTAERLFVVCNPGPPPSYAMRDVFGRFGSLIDVYLLAGKNYGYVKYANKESAESAIQTLHGQEICGSRLKVMPADPRTDDRRKRLRVDDP